MEYRTITIDQLAMSLNVSHGSAHHIIKDLGYQKKQKKEAKHIMPPIYTSHHSVVTNCDADFV
jgi:ribosomal protein S25